MKIITEKMMLSDLPNIEEKTYFDDMIKAVVDIEKRVLALNAELHCDLEQLLLENGSAQNKLYGFNIWFDGEIEYDSMINPPRNREDGYPRVGRYVADPNVRETIEEIVDEWIIER